MAEKKALFKLIGSFVSLICIFVLLVISSVILFRPDSFAWFANSKNVNSSGMQLEIEKRDITMTYYRKGPSDTDYVKIESFESVFDGLVPGDTVWLKIAYDSKASRDHSVTVYLDSFDGCEAPLIIDGRYYYYGTQLKILETGEFLLSPPADSISYESESQPQDRKIGTVSLSANSITEASENLEISLENAPEDAVCSVAITAIRSPSEAASLAAGVIIGREISLSSFSSLCHTLDAVQQAISIFLAPKAESLFISARVRAISSSSLFVP